MLICTGWYKKYEENFKHIKGWNRKRFHWRASRQCNAFMKKSITGFCLSKDGIASDSTGRASRQYNVFMKKSITVPVIGSGSKNKQEKHDYIFNLLWRLVRMARISGVDLPREKRVEIGLTYIFGIGRASSNRILAKANVNPDTRCKDLTDDEVGRIRDVIDESYMVEGDLKREIALNIKRLQEIGCYRGIRHRKGLPVRGQKTKTNARTRKGPKRTVANKKK